MKAPPQTRTATQYILIAISIAALAVLLWRIAEVFIVAFGGIVFAAAIRSVADPLERKAGLSRRWSLAVVVVGGLLLFGLTAWLFGNQVASQMTELQQRLPEAANKFQGWLARSQAGRVAVESAHNAFADSKMLSGLGLAATAVVAAIGDLLLIFYLSIYFAADPELYCDGALRLIPLHRRPQVKSALLRAADALRKWLLGQLIAMVSVGVLAGVSLALIGVPLPFSLGLLAGILEFIPIVGPILSAVPGVLLAFAKGPEMALYALLVYTAVQQIEGNIIIPVVQRWAVQLAPVLGLLAVVAVGLLFGVLGIVFATPAAVVVISLISQLYVEDTLENDLSTEPKEPSLNA